ncbi:MAG: MoxR family ATPase [Clostridiales bacterium]|jgi:MoxR-like ATPase|nr:MoxR family ATPase [Clostridiales bacterium]
MSEATLALSANQNLALSTRQNISINKQDLDDFNKKFNDLGYFFSSQTVLQQIFLTLNFYNLQRKGLSGVLLAGEPGVGKSFLAEVLSKVAGYELLQYQCTASTTDEQLFATISPVGVVTRNEEEMIKKGILTQAIDRANNGEKIVLLIDEIDKANENIDPYFLTFMQDAFCFTPEFGAKQVDNDKRENLIVIVCKNKWRELDGSLLRRLRRVELELPTAESMQRIVDFSGDNYDPAMRKIALILYAHMRKERESFSRVATAQEIINALNDDILLEKIEASAADRLFSLLNWFSNNHDADFENLCKVIKDFAKFDITSEFKPGFEPVLNLTSEESERLLNPYGEFFKEVFRVIQSNLTTYYATNGNNPKLIGIVKYSGNNIDFNIQQKELTFLQTIINTTPEKGLDKRIKVVNMADDGPNSCYMAAVPVKTFDSNYYLLFSNQKNMNTEKFITGMRTILGQEEKKTTFFAGKVQAVGGSDTGFHNAMLSVEGLEPNGNNAKFNFWGNGGAR